MNYLLSTLFWKRFCFLGILSFFNFNGTWVMFLFISELHIYEKLQLKKMHLRFCGSANAINVSTVVMHSNSIANSISVFGDFAASKYNASITLGANACMYGVATFKSAFTNIDRIVCILFNFTTKLLSFCRHCRKWLIHGNFRLGVDTKLTGVWSKNTAIAYIIVHSSTFVSSQPVFVKSMILPKALWSSFCHSLVHRSSAAYLSVTNAFIVR